MGYARHHTIVVHSWDGCLIKQAHKRAKEIFRWVSPLSPEVVNGFRSFFIPTDGSKEGWDESNRGDERRDIFITWLKERVEVDGSSCIGWVEVQYCDDNFENRVVRSSDDVWKERQSL